MKKKIGVAVMLLFSTGLFAQEQEAQQLLLNVEKLMQFRKILKNMYDGWKIVNKGYNTVKQISAGNFKLHEAFLDALMEVSPAVKNYQRVKDIIRYQLQIAEHSKLAFQRFRGDDVFTIAEIEHIGKVYANLLHASVQQLDELLLIITAGKLRMSDDERLKAIDRIYAIVSDQFAFLRDHTSSTSYLSLQRKAEKAELEMERRVLGH